MSELNDIKVENEEFWWEPMDDFASEYDNDDSRNFVDKVKSWFR